MANGLSLPIRLCISRMSAASERKEGDATLTFSLAVKREGLSSIELSPRESILTLMSQFDPLRTRTKRTVAGSLSPLPRGVRGLVYPTPCLHPPASYLPSHPTLTDCSLPSLVDSPLGDDRIGNLTLAVIKMMWSSN